MNNNYYQENKDIFNPQWSNKIYLRVIMIDFMN
jgi:hypothetical protein